MRKLPESTRVRPASTDPVEVQIMGQGFLDIVNARDIGLGGVGVWIPHGFTGCDTSVPVELVLTLPSHKSFLVRGRIRHRTADDAQNEFFGIEFTNLTQKHRRVLSDYLLLRLHDDPMQCRRDRKDRKR